MATGRDRGWPAKGRWPHCAVGLDRDIRMNRLL